jgi:membrane dipeptidase
MFGLTVSDGGYEVVPRSEIDHAYAVLFTNAVLETLDQLISEANGAVQLVRMADDIEECVRRKRFAIVPGFEGAEAIREDLSNLAGYYQQGLRALGPVWSRPNRFVEGVPFRFPGNTYTGPGLSATGRELVRECNRLGIVIDLAHINMRGFRDVAQLSQAPLVVSHTDVHALCSSAARLIRAFGMPFQLIRIEVNVAKISGAVPFCLVVKVPGVRMTALAACHYRLPG